MVSLFIITRKLQVVNPSVNMRRYDGNSRASLSDLFNILGWEGIRIRKGKQKKKWNWVHIGSELVDVKGQKSIIETAKPIFWFDKVVVFIKDGGQETVTDGTGGIANEGSFKDLFFFIYLDKFWGISKIKFYKQFFLLLFDHVCNQILFCFFSKFNFICCRCWSDIILANDKEW